ncbi:EamA family transporter [Dictyobacter kobayashii]|uniref:Multidrug transporter n=1 Tax=Dictyobacter kobayashii TaxID=2014872 RepID=A0A402AUD1_9CHLR|nr:DMT family transporter [Dictyobacter kobayashii]GCE22659.1 multidrug transporter [Dictyobacter kobayashii]
MKRLTASILVLIGAASFGILSTIVKISYSQGFSTAQITSSQILFGCLCLWLFSIPSFKDLRTLSRMTIGKLIASGVFGGLTGVFYYLALQWLSASFGVILLFQFVWMGFLLAWLLERRRPTVSQWIAIVVVLIGTVLAAGYEALHFEHLNLIGVIFGLLAAASYTGNLAVNGRVELQVPSILRSTLMVSGSAITTLLIFPPFFLFNGTTRPNLWIFAVLLGLFGVIIPLYLYARGIPVVGSAMASILGSIELPVVITSSALVLHEHITLVQWLGVFLILLGIFISEQRIINHKTFKKGLGGRYMGARWG